MSACPSARLGRASEYLYVPAVSVGALVSDPGNTAVLFVAEGYVPRSVVVHPGPGKRPRPPDPDSPQSFPVGQFPIGVEQMGHDATP